MNQERVTCPLRQCDWYVVDPGFPHWEQQYREDHSLTGTISEHVARVREYREIEIEDAFMDHWGTHTPREVLTEIRDLNDRVQRMDALIQSSKEILQKFLQEEE